MGGILTPQQQNPMMTYDPQQGLQMPIKSINPGDLQGQARYAYNQMMAALISDRGSNPQQLSPEMIARQRAIMQMYFPQMGGRY